MQDYFAANRSWPARRWLACWSLLLALNLGGCAGVQTAASATAQPATRTAAAEGQDTASKDATAEATAEATAATARVAAPSKWGYTVVDELEHDINAFTQGLVYADGIFYEGTGLRGQSTLRKVDPDSGEVLAGVRYPDEYFAEGVAVFGERIFQLTWQSNTGFIFDKETLDAVGQFSYPTEGWGLTHDGTRLIMSDGTATLYFLDPATQEITGELIVQDDQGPVARLNELEFVNGQLLANVWQTERIAVVDPATGYVTAYLDLAGLPDEDARAELQATFGLADEAALAAFLQSRGTLNGIAYDAAGDRLFVTGKLWPEIYEIDVVTGEE